MRRAVTLVLAASWTVLFGFAGMRQADRLSVLGGFGADGATAIAALAALTILSAIAFLWALCAVSTGSDNDRSGQGDVYKLATCVALAATVAMAASDFAARPEGQALHAAMLQLTALLVSYLVARAERPVEAAPVDAANDNSQSAARLLAMLAATDAKINRIARRGFGEREDFR